MDTSARPAKMLGLFLLGLAVISLSGAYFARLATDDAGSAKRLVLIR